MHGAIRSRCRKHWRPTGTLVSFVSSERRANICVAAQPFDLPSDDIGAAEPLFSAAFFKWASLGYRFQL